VKQKYKRTVLRYICYALGRSWTPFPPPQPFTGRVAVDASGFSTSRFVRWHDHKYGRETQAREWFKCHLVCGVKTKIVTAVDISGWTVHDSYFFVPLIKRTAQSFDISEVAADKAYLGHWNMEVVEEVGRTPYIPFKSNTVVPKDDSIWAKMYHLFMFYREEFMVPLPQALQRRIRLFDGEGQVRRFGKE
jgi:hypothetical protein